MRKIAFLSMLLLMALACSKHKEDAPLGKEPEEPQTPAPEPEPDLTDYFTYVYDNPWHKKAYYWLNTNYAFLSVKEPKLPADIAERSIKAAVFRSDSLNRRIWQYRELPGAWYSWRYWTELSFEEELSDEEYLELLSDIKHRNSDVIISPYLTKDTSSYYALHVKKLAVSNIFYVKLKSVSDIALLEQMAEQNGAIIIAQDGTAPHWTARLWFALSVTESSRLNSLEYAKLFYESGLFAAAEPDFMTNDLL